MNIQALKFLPHAAPLLAPEFDSVMPCPAAVGLAGELLAARHAAHPLVEGLRTLRSELLLRWLDVAPGGKSLAVVSAERREGRSFVAANLAVVFAQLGRRALLIDADLRQGRQHALFGLENRTGLSALLAEGAGLEAIAPIPSIAGLSVLSAGPTPPNPQELLSQPRFADVLDQLRGLFDVVLIDSPAHATAADVQIIAARAGAALLVSQPHAATVERSQALVAALGQTRVGLVGAVVNKH
ncbi:polysaccharide biosynthesis tyrosine autokinase [Methylomagnum sp.]